MLQVAFPEENIQIEIFFLQRKFIEETVFLGTTPVGLKKAGWSEGETEL